MANVIIENPNSQAQDPKLLLADTLQFGFEFVRFLDVKGDTVPP